MLEMLDMKAAMEITVPRVDCGMWNFWYMYSEIRDVGIMPEARESMKKSPQRRRRVRRDEGEIWAIAQVDFLCVRVGRAWCCCAVDWPPLVEARKASDSSSVSFCGGKVGLGVGSNSQR